MYDSGDWSVLSFRYVLVLIASFNVSDLIGRYLPLIEQIKLTSRKGLLLAVISRFLLIPAFYFTAKYGDQGWMIMLTSLLGLSNGHLTVCVLTEAPKGYKVGVWTIWATMDVFNCVLLKECTCLCFAGSRTKCLRKPAGAFPLGRYICWRCFWLVVAHRQRMVKPNYFFFTGQPRKQADHNWYLVLVVDRKVFSFSIAN